MLAVGFFIGLIVGVLGVGGGFVLVPALIYVIGLPSFMAVGTSLFQMIFSSAYGCIRHTMDGNVIIFASVIMLFLVYLFVPHVSVSPRAAFIGSASATVFLQISRQAFSFLMVRFDVYGRVYGPLASFIMFMSWLYVSMTIILLGAELGSRCQEIHLGTVGAESEPAAEAE